MRSKLALLLLVPFLSTGIDLSGTTGRQVIVSLAAGDSLTGELLSVRVDALVIAPKPEISEADMEVDSAAVKIVPLREITKVYVKSQSYIGPAMLDGIILGAAVGTGLACNSADLSRERGSDIVLYSVGTGCCLGLGIGTAVSKSSFEADPAKPGDILLLKEAARYREEEPEFLKARVM